MEGIPKESVRRIRIRRKLSDEMYDQGCPIMRKEFERALRNLRKNEAPGVDGLQGEILKFAGHEVRERLFKLVICICETGIVPEDFKWNILLIVPKKRGADRGENLRTINLTFHASEILTRMEKRAEEILGEDEFGFRRNNGTRVAIFALQVL